MSLNIVSLHNSSEPKVFDDDEYAADAVDRGDFGDAGDIEINVEDYLKAARRPIEVTNKNKIVCFTAFVVLIASICVYLAVLATFHLKYTIMSDVRFRTPTDIIYVLMISDIVASCVGTWTCLKKTGPQPMIYSCVWLLLSSLINVCVTISLTFETKEYRKLEDTACKKELGGSPTSEACTAYFEVKIVLWCSLLSFLLKITVIILCRINYPQVFNWMMGKDVYVDEDLLPRDSNRKMIVSAGTLAGAYFDPPDLARIAARGSLRDATVIKNSSNQAIFIKRESLETKKPKADAEEDEHMERMPTRRSTFVSLTT